MTRLAAVVALVTAAAPGLALAQSPGVACEAQRPSDHCHPVYEDYEEVAPVVAIETPAPEKPAFERRGAPRIHGALMDTGHLMPAGTFQFAGRAYGALAQVAVGLHDRLELSSDLVGYGAVGASIGFRASLTEAESPFRAVVGAKLWTLEDTDVKPVQISGTVAYQSEQVNVHANLLEMPTDSDRVWVVAIGAVLEINPKVSLTGDAGRIQVGDDLVEGVVAGIKLTGTMFDIDLTVAANAEGAFPLVGLTGRI